MGTVIFLHRVDIKDGAGPSAFKRLYEDYKPDHCLWEIYQLLQKVMLCGLLGFVERGTLTQASLGLVVSETVLLSFMRTLPYNDFRTNLLAITAQLILVFSFFSTILLKADMAGEVLTPNRVGVLMVVVNLPMALFFVWDVRLDVVEHFAAVLALDNVMMNDEDNEDTTVASMTRATSAIRWM